MALNIIRQQAFTQQWVDGLAMIPNQFMSATIRITDSDVGEAVYNRVTGKFEVPARAILWEGQARVTPRRTALNHPVPGRTTNTQTVQFQIPISEAIDHGLDLRPKQHRVSVVESPLMPNLANFLFVVTEVVDSAAPIEYTFWCNVDQNMEVSE